MSEAPPPQFDLAGVRASPTRSGTVELIARRPAEGTAVIEVTAVPHTGCGKFTRRFGVHAQKLVNSHDGRELNLRGINAKVLRAGTVRTGDPVEKLR